MDPRMTGFVKHRSCNDSIAMVLSVLTEILSLPKTHRAIENRKSQESKEYNDESNLREPEEYHEELISGGSSDFHDFNAPSSHINPKCNESEEYHDESNLNEPKESHDNSSLNKTNESYESIHPYIETDATFIKLHNIYRRGKD